MKKLFGILLLAVAIAVLCSCGGTTTPDNGNDGPVKPPYDAIIISGEDYNVSPIRDAIEAATGKIAYVKMHDAEESENELAIGNTNRAITAEAKYALESSLGELDWDMAAYIIYAKDGDVAVYWTHAAAMQVAIDRLADEYLEKGRITFDNGIVELEDYSYIEAKEAEEAIVREEQLATIEANFGEGVRAAVEEYLALADEDFYLWLANLYDPGEYDDEGNPLGGGFYYANSARDTQGYLPDIESTRQVMSFLTSSGMLKAYGNDFTKAFPEKMQKEIIAFAQSLQSPENGYFYHPQWGTNVSVGRYSRDMNNSITVLKNLGTKPLYNTPTGTKGLYGDPPGVKASAYLTDRLGDGSVAVAVSQVIGAASVQWSNQLKTLDAWKSYLNDQEATITTNSYSIGHNIASQASQIISRENQAIKNGEIENTDSNGDGIADGGFIAAFEEFFDSHQLDNGLWEPGSVADGTITYTAVNGLMKISNGYSSLGLRLKKLDAAMESALFIASKEGADCTGDTPKNSVDVYNPWVSVVNVLDNAKSFGEDGQYGEMRAMLKARAEELIRITITKISKFEKLDGSFGYTIGTNTPNSQGCPAAVPGIDEGDVNGGCIAFNSTISNMFSALGITLQRYFDSDFDKFIHEINGLSHVEKVTIILENEPIDFENCDIGDNSFTNMTSKMESGYVEVCKDPIEGGDHGNVLKFVAASEGFGDNVTTTVGGSAIDSSCFEFSFDICITEYNKKNTIVFRMTLSNCYRLYIKYTGGKFVLGDDSNKGNRVDFDATMELGRWYNIRAEYYPGAEGSARIKVYLDDKLVTVSSNYFGNDGTAAPATKTSTFNIYSYFPVIHTTYIDNITANRTDKQYVSETPSTKPEEVKPDKPAIANGNFEELNIGDTEIPGMTLSVNSGEAGNRIAIDRDPENPANKVLAIETNPNAGSKVNNQMRFKAADTSGSCYVLDTDVYIAEELSEKTNLQISLCGDSSGNIVSTNCYIRSDRISSLTTREADGSSPTVASDIKVDGWFNLRMEYYSKENMLKVFIDGKFVCEAKTYYSEKAKGEALGYVKIQPVFASDVLMYLDNLTVEAIDKAYVAGDTSK